jgi:hypothetical protein
MGGRDGASGVQRLYCTASTPTPESHVGYQRDPSGRAQGVSRRLLRVPWRSGKTKPLGYDGVLSASAFGDAPPEMPDWQMFWIVKHGIRYSGMGAWEGEASEEKMWQMVTFLSQLRQLPPEVQAEWIQQPK